MISQRYKKELSNTCILSIQIRLDGLSFDVFDPVKNVFLIVENNIHKRDMYYGQQQEIFLREELFHLPYRKTVVALTDPDFTAIPTALFDPQQSKQLLQFAGYNVQKDCCLLSDNLSMAGLTVVYPVPIFLYYFLKSEVPNLTLLHQATAIANVLLLKRLEDYDSRVAVHFTSQKMIVVATHNNMLKLCNTFSYTDHNNSTYIVLNILEQLGVTPERTRIEVSGDISQSDRRFTWLEHFANNVVVAKEPKWFDYGGKIDDVWRYADMLNLMLCV